MSLESRRFGWPTVAGLSVAIVVAGQFSGWNYGLSGGWANMFIATFLMAILYSGLALCVAELAAALPQAGGLATYVEQAFGRLPGFLAALSIFLALAIGTGAAANFISAYAASLVGIGGTEITIILFVSAMAIYALGAGEGLTVVFVAGAIAVISLLAFILVMLPRFDVVNLGDQLDWKISLAGIINAVPFAVWLFLGVEQAATAAEETRDPGRNMPRGLLTGIAILLTTALGVLLLAPGGSSTSLIASAADPLLAAMRHGGSSRLAGAETLVAFGAVFGLAATFFSLYFSASRQLFSMASKNDVPKFIGTTNARGAPIVALLTVGVVGAAASFASPDHILIGVVLLLSICYILTLSAFLLLRHKRPDLERPFVAPAGPLIATICLPLAALVFISCFQISLSLILGIGIPFVVGILLHIWNVRRAPSQHSEPL